MVRRIAESELILNEDGSIYHLNLHPDELADTIVTVGDPNRVSAVSKHFDQLEIKKAKREIVTHTGYIGSRRLTVLSTGMGPGNIDIVLNELDALVNIDFNNRQIKKRQQQLTLIRLGTSGSLHPDVQPDDIVISQYAIGLDTAMSFYGTAPNSHFEEFLQLHKARIPHHYWAECDKSLNTQIRKEASRGVTITSPGFYGAQNRSIRLPYSMVLPFDQFHTFEIENIPITNMEMETASLYFMANQLGHRALSVNCILANRLKGTFSSNPKASVNKMIIETLEDIVTA